MSFWHGFLYNCLNFSGSTILKEKSFPFGLVLRSGRLWPRAKSLMSNPDGALRIQNSLTASQP